MMMSESNSGASNQVASNKATFNRASRITEVHRTKVHQSEAEVHQKPINVTFLHTDCSLGISRFFSATSSAHPGMPWKQCSRSGTPGKHLESSRSWKCGSKGRSRLAFGSRWIHHL